MDPNEQLSDVASAPSSLPRRTMNEVPASFTFGDVSASVQLATSIGAVLGSDEPKEVSIFVSLFTTTRSLALNAIDEGRKARWNTETAKKASDGRRFMFCFLQAVSV